VLIVGGGYGSRRALEGDRLIPLCERTVIAGKYRLERELASGGMGAVWVARHLQLDEAVAVKFMSATIPQLADARSRFAREARAAARLRSPHVVQVLDHGVDADVPYIVMELLEGEHLGDRLKRQRRLPLRVAATIAAQVGKALGRAHRAGIVHRDLKPANVFLARLDDEEIVKILDFGIAKSLHDEGAEVTGSDVLLGSPQYMSPEQARGSRRTDHRADLWSLGAILYRAVTGVPAFDGVSAVDVIVHICTGPIPVASKVAPDLPPAIDAFFLRALARDPEDRFASAREMTEAAEISAGRRSPDSADDLQTFVMEHRVANNPRARLARLAAASPAEIDAFVERAFGALLEGPFSPTTRCASARTMLPPPLPTGRSPAPVRVALEQLAPGSFGEPCEDDAGSRAKPTAEGAGEDRVPRIPMFPPRPTGMRPIRATHDADDEAVLDEDPSTVSLLIDQGFVALRRGEPDSARRAWQEALDRDPGNRALALNLRRLGSLGATPRGISGARPQRS
jgi:serine/threonine protein kinase